MRRRGRSAPGATRWVGPVFRGGAWQPGRVTDATPGDPDGRPPARRPVLLVVLTAAVALEAGLLVGVAVFYVVGLAAGRATDAVVAGTTAGLALLIAGALGLFARGLWARRRWARAPVVTWNILVALSVASSGAVRTPLGAALLVLAVLVVAGLLAPSVSRATSGTAEPPVT